MKFFMFNLRIYYSIELSNTVISKLPNTGIKCFLVYGLEFLLSACMGIVSLQLTNSFHQRFILEDCTSVSLHKSDFDL